MKDKLEFKLNERYLVSIFEYEDITEIKVIDFSPSRKYVKIRDMNGGVPEANNISWIPSDTEIIEQIS